MHSYYMKELCRFESMGKCAGKLVGTAGTLAATVDTSQASNGIGHLHTLAQGTDSKQIALAAAFERHTADYVGFKDNVDLHRAHCTAGCYSDFAHRSFGAVAQYLYIVYIHSDAKIADIFR